MKKETIIHVVTVGFTVAKEAAKAWASFKVGRFVRESVSENSDTTTAEICGGVATIGTETILNNFDDAITGVVRTLSEKVASKKSECKSGELSDKDDNFYAATEETEEEEEA